MAARPGRRVAGRVPGAGTATGEVFIDTSGFFALLSEADPAHARACEQMDRLARTRRRTVTTDHVLDETFTLLKVRGLAHRCPAFEQMVRTSRSLRVHWTEPAVFAAATTLFLSRLDQGFSFTDCVSFTVMEQERLQEALTTDYHFRIAGFAPLLWRQRGTPRQKAPRLPAMKAEYLASSPQRNFVAFCQRIPDAVADS